MTIGHHSFTDFDYSSELVVEQLNNQNFINQVAL
jgi:hypothetical protein